MNDKRMNGERRSSSIVNGWIILDKPSGITSAHAVAKVKRLLKPKKIGHAGTLDPLASGILPLALGEATKTVPYMMDAGKSYAFTVQWGSETESDDCQGKVIRTSNKRPCLHEIDAILPKFSGLIEQTPPSYSAIKVDGKRAYALARAGEEVALKARKVRVDALAVIPAQAGIKLAANAPATLDPGLRQDDTFFLCHCGKGTYIRSLARDMGRALGCLGHITRLRRLKVGSFSENHAISLEVLEEMVHKGDLSFLRPVESALDDIPAQEVTFRQAMLLKQGQSFFLPGREDASGAIVLAKQEGMAIAICSLSQGWMKPVRVFNIVNDKESYDVA